MVFPDKTSLSPHNPTLPGKFWPIDEYKRREAHGLCLNKAHKLVYM